MTRKQKLHFIKYSPLFSVYTKLNFLLIGRIKARYLQGLERAKLYLSSAQFCLWHAIEGASFWPTTLQIIKMGKDGKYVGC